MVTAANPEQGGSVSPDGGTYSLGETVNVKATSAGGWQFTSWSGDTTVSTNPLSITMNKDYQLTAQFEQVKPDESILSTSAQPANGGNIDPSGGSFTSRH
ncbi:MAG: hypothetical protein U5J63_05575 [Fodinibius sp.]|nr:hypothetical protein [Fodinibius sp.]